MKKHYEELELEIVRFGAEDVITASAEDPGDTSASDKTDGGNTSSGSQPSDDGVIVIGGVTYTPAGYNVNWDDGNSYPVYTDENGDPYGYVNGEMIYFV